MDVCSDRKKGRCLQPRLEKSSIFSDCFWGKIYVYWANVVCFYASPMIFCPLRTSINDVTTICHSLLTLFRRGTWENEDTILDKFFFHGDMKSRFDNNFFSVQGSISSTSVCPAFKHAKKTAWLACLFALLGSALVKVARKMLVNLTLEVNPTNFFFT